MAHPETLLFLSRHDFIDLHLYQAGEAALEKGASDYG
jgi:hypothetical protein